jgi:hypothetical protein
MRWFGRLLCWWGAHEKPKRRQVVYVYVCGRCLHLINETRLP